MEELRITLAVLATFFWTLCAAGVIFGGLKLFKMEKEVAEVTLNSAKDGAMIEQLNERVAEMQFVVIDLQKSLSTLTDYATSKDPEYSHKNGYEIESDDIPIEDPWPQVMGLRTNAATQLEPKH